MSAFISRGLVAAGLALVLGGPACAQGSNDIAGGDDETDFDSGGAAGDDTGTSGGDSAAHHDSGGSGGDSGGVTDASAGQDAGVGVDASAGQDSAVMQPDASQQPPDSGVVMQPDASVGSPTNCPMDSIHSAEAVIELAKSNPKTCITASQCSVGECCYVPFVCVAQ